MASEKIRTDFKMELFLKGTLSQDVYERIQLYEFCIVISPREDKVMKYVVIGDDAIYLTEFPPRIIKPEVYFQQVMSIDWVQDYPDFLDGEFRMNCVHICIRYKSDGHRDSSRQSVSATSLLSSRSTNASTSEAEKEKTKSVEVESTQVAQAQKHICGCLPSSKTAVADPSSNSLSSEAVISNTARSTTNSSSGSASNNAKKYDRHICQLHLYVTNGDSPAYLVLKNAWNNCMIRSTLLLDTGMLQACTPRGGHLQEDTVNLLFSQLKMDIIAAEHSEDTEALFHLTNELRQATLRNYALKKQFWRNGAELFQVFVNQCSRYLPTSSLDLQLERNRAPRTDELDLSLLLLDTLKIMFQETENLPSRVSFLRRFGGREVLELLQLLFCEPVPSEPLSVLKELNKEFEDEKLSLRQKQQIGMHMEVQNLLHQYTDISVAILYDLLIAAKNTSGESAASAHTGSCLRLCELGVVRILERHADAAAWLQRLSAAVIHPLSPPSKAEAATGGALLSPLQLVALFKGLTVLKAILRNSKTLKHLVLNEFTEEFKYFVQERSVHRRVSMDCPLSAPTIALIAEVKKLVTGNNN